VDLTVTPAKGPIHVVLDASGFKVYGEGEWKVRQHGVGQRRTWMKLHIGVDEATGQIVAALSTGTEWGDSSAVPELLNQIGEEIKQVSADGAYDTEAVYKQIAKRGARATIPPCAGAVSKRGRDPDRYRERNRNLAEIKARGKQDWKLSSGYSRRSHDETAFSRIKRRLGDSLHTRNYDNQLGELLLLVRIINQMTALGMPKAEWTPA
jgi:transposase